MLEIITIAALIVSALGSLAIIVVTAFYAFVAPWFHSRTGQSFMSLLAALSLLIIAQITFSIFDDPLWLQIARFIVGAAILAAMIFVGVVIGKAQLGKKVKDTVVSKD